MQEKIMVMQDSDPQNKRANAYYNPKKKRIDSHLHHLPEDQWQTKYYHEVKFPEDPDFGVDMDGDADAQVTEAAAILRNTNDVEHAGHHEYDRESRWIEVK
jgi:hypothetical protein